MKKHIQRWLKEAQTRLLLDHWTIIVNWEMKDKDVLMNCSVMNEYRTANIGVNLRVCENAKNTQGWERIKAAAYHELAHVLIWRLAGVNSPQRRREEDEKLAEVIAKIVLR